MSLGRRELQRSIDRFEAPEPALDRLLRRRQRRERRKRIEAGAVALAVVALTGALIGRSFLIGEPADRQPASPPACDAGKWQTPSPAGVSGAVLGAVTTSDTDTYVAVQDQPGTGYSLLHHGVAGWASVPTPTSGYSTIAAPPVTSGSQSSSLWLLSEDAVWVLRDGSWSALPTLPLATGEHARALAVAGADDIWVAVSTDRGTTMLHLDGTSWVRSQLPGGDLASHVLALGLNDVWVGGGQTGTGTESVVPFMAHWDGSGWTDVAGPSLPDSAVTALAASAGDVWAAAETSVSGGHPTTHLLHLRSGEWADTATFQGDSYRFHLLAGGASGVWWYDWTTPDGPPTSIEHWSGTRWEPTAPVPGGWDLAGNELWQLTALDVTAAGADVVRMGARGVVDFRYTC
jgi:hypothetical protein